MPNPLAIDAHAHICTEETMKLLNKETPKVASSLKEYEKDISNGRSAGVPYRPLPRGGFDIEQRLKDMKASDVDMQVLSNTPQTFLYNQDAGHDDRGLRRPERPDRQARPRLSEKLLRHRHAADAGAEGRGRRTGARDFQARPQGHADRLQHQRQESRRAGVRAGVAGGEPAPRVLHGASEQRRRHRPAEELLPQQPDRQSARHHHRGGLAWCSAA